MFNPEELASATTPNHTWCPKTHSPNLQPPVNGATCASSTLVVYITSQCETVWMSGVRGIDLIHDLLMECHTDERRDRCGCHDQVKRPALTRLGRCVVDIACKHRSLLDSCELWTIGRSVVLSCSTRTSVGSKEARERYVQVRICTCAARYHARF